MSSQWEDDVGKTMLVIVFGILKILSYKKKMVPLSFNEPYIPCKISSF